MLDKKVFKLLCCPYDKSAILKKGSYLTCQTCHRTYPIINNVPYLLPDSIKSQNKEVQVFLKKNKIKRAHLKEDNLEEVRQFIWGDEKVEAKWGAVANFLKKCASFKRRETFLSTPKSYSLDIGCGNKPRGDVNMDIFLPSPVPKNFVMASAEFLPFKPNTFDRVVSVHVLEHLVSPAKFIKHQSEISRGKVLMIVDNSEWLGNIWMRLANSGALFCKQHYYQWTKEYLANLIARLGLKGKLKFINFNPSFLTNSLSLPGKIKTLRNFFYIDLLVEITK